MKKDYRDPTLSHFVVKNTSGPNPILPQMIPQELVKIVYCTNHNLTLDEGTVPCLPWPFSVPMNQNFSTAEYVHSAEQVYFSGNTQVDIIQGKTYSPVEADGYFVDQMNLIGQVRANNALIAKLEQQIISSTVVKKEEPSDMSYSSNLVLYWLMSYGFDALTVTSLLLTLYHCCKPGQPSESTNEHVTYFAPPQNSPAPPEVVVYPADLHRNQ